MARLKEELVVLRPLHPTPTAWNLHARHRLDLASGERGGYDTTTPLSGRHSLLRPTEPPLFGGSHRETGETHPGSDPGAGRSPVIARRTRGQREEGARRRPVRPSRRGPGQQ